MFLVIWLQIKLFFKMDFYNKTKQTDRKSGRGGGSINFPLSIIRPAFPLKPVSPWEFEIE